MQRLGFAKHHVGGSLPDDVLRPARRALASTQFTRLRRPRPGLQEAPRGGSRRLQPRDYRRRLRRTRPAYKPNIAFYEQCGIPGLRALEADARRHPLRHPGHRRRETRRHRQYRRGLRPRDVRAVGFRRRHRERLPGPRCRRAVPRLRRTTASSSSAGRRTPARASSRSSALDTGRMLYEAGRAHAPPPGRRTSAWSWAPPRRRNWPGVRALVPEAPLLVPGVGAQGGLPEDVVRSGGLPPREDGGQRVAARSSTLRKARGSPRQRAPPRWHLRDELREAAAPVA